MFGQGRPFAAALICCCLFVTPAVAQRSLQLQLDPKRVSAKPTPLQDDANLNDVQFVGLKNGWAVGDRGVVWRTADGGKTWQFVKTPVDCPLRSVCFLTDQVGWIAGGGTTPYTRLGYGVVLVTSDGGTTWQSLAAKTLPRVHYVRFFDLEHGVVVGDASSEFATGIAMTSDAGKTWQPIPGPRQTGWRAADFLMPEVGAVTGQQSTVALVGGGRLLKPRIANHGLRGFRDVEIRRDETGWLVGDGGLVLRTDNGGVVWQPPATDFPEHTADIFNFHAVDCRSQKVWIAGAPGSVIWHTPDGGRTWIKQYTPQTVPINAIQFTSETTGCTVGDLGTILRTADGGATWTAVRGTGRRAAIMAVQARTERLSLNLLALYSGELGYRSVVLLPARRDVGPDGHHSVDLDLRLQDGVAAAGGSVAEFDWRFPIVMPGLERDRDQLIADWDRRTENRFREVFLGTLVRGLRTWRPSLVIIDRTASDDATASLVNSALLRAVEQANDPTRFVHHLQLAGLKPWHVEKVYERLPPGSTGETHVDLHRYLPRLRSTVQTAAAPGQSMLAPLSRQTARREAYRLMIDQISKTGPKISAHDFFSGIPLLPGSSARRPLLPFDDRDYETRQKLAKHQRNYQAVVERSLDDPIHGAQLIALLKPMIVDLPDAEAALHLAQLAEEYRRRSQWDLVEATMVELVERFPDQPVAQTAMVRLFQLWSAAEPVWQRVRKVHVGRQQFQVDAAAIRSRIEKAESLARVSPTLRDLSTADLGPDPIRLLSSSGTLKTAGDKSWRRAATDNWLDQALRMASLLRSKSPALYRTPEVQFSVASLLRQRGAHRLADGFYRRFDGSQDVWDTTAATELWLLHPVSLPPKEMVVCRRTAVRPVLDGLLSDRCWQNAEIIRLTGSPGEKFGERHHAFAMLSYDAQYLYFAASVPRHQQTPPDGPMHAGRTHDADLRKFDRVSLFLDVDRDYATFYSLSIDQRGWTSDACWDDPSWNPKWHVYCAADENGWRVEAAILLQELVPLAPQKNVVWAVGIVRTIPTVGLESWTHPAGTRPRPETFGLLRFD